MTAVAATPTAPTPPAAARTAASGPTGATAPAVPKLKVGETLDWSGELAQVAPSPAKVHVDQRGGKPLVLFFWGTGNAIARDDLATFDAWVKKEGLRKSMDVYAVGGYSSDKGSGADLRDMAAILGITEVPILADPDFLLTTRMGAEQYPEIDVVSSDGKLLAKAIRGLDHANLQATTGTKGEVTVYSGADYIKAVATQKTGPPIPRTFPYYPSDRLIGKKYPDFELPRFSAEGWGKGKPEKLSGLLSGKLPAMVMFFSATCEHCQVDVPQMVKFLKDHPGQIEVVGITRIRNEQHRKVSAAYFQQQGIQFPVLEDAGAQTDAWLVTSTPTEFYLTPGGTVTDVTYYQHENLDADWTRIIASTKKAPEGKAGPKATGWSFPLSFKDQAGKEVALGPAGGKPTLLHFWATWCIPCRTELPHLVARIPELQARANVVFASVEPEAAPIAKHRKDTGLTFDSLHAPHGGLAAKIDFGRSVPRTYLLDATGHVLAVYAGSYEWDDPDKFGRVLGRLTP